MASISSSAAARCALQPIGAAALACSLLLALIPVDRANAAPAVCAPASADGPRGVLQAVTDLFAALQAQDLAGFSARVTPTFYAYDVGKRLTAMQLFDAVKAAHAAGKRYTWAVTEAQATALCDWAWITYVNEGSLEDASGRQELQWLESAILRYEDGQWRVQFLHSTRVPTAAAK
jgi:hypothetical protein